LRLRVISPFAAQAIFERTILAGSDDLLGRRHGVPLDNWPGGQDLPPPFFLTHAAADDGLVRPRPRPVAIQATDAARGL
jgi:hypothetical protein